MPLAVSLESLGLAALSPLQLAGLALASVVLLQIVAQLVGACLLERKLASVPKVPSTYPFSHLIALTRTAPWDLLQEWVQKAGKIVRFHFFQKTYIVVGDPDMAEHILQTNLKNYCKDRNTYETFADLLGTGLVTSEGELWRRQRALISSVFKVGILQETATVSRLAVDRLTAKLLPLADGKTEVQIGEEFRRLTLQVIGEAVLSLPPEESDRVFPDLYLPIVDECNRRTWAPWRKYMPLRETFEYNRCVKALNSYVTELIERRHRELQSRADGKGQEPERRTDILDRILAAVADQPWTPTLVRQLRDEIKTFLFAGHETSSMMLTWSLYQLTQNPRCLAKVREEARGVFKGEAFKEESPAYDDLANLHYTQAVLREALRLYSVVPVVTRQAVEDDVICGHPIPANSHMVVHIKAIHYRPDLWPEPDAFRPERFEGKPQYHPFSFLPFINGPRNCIGQHFAQLEAKIVLALLVNRFEVTPAPGELGQRHPHNIPIAPRDWMRVTVKRRA